MQEKTLEQLVTSILSSNKEMKEDLATSERYAGTPEQCMHDRLCALDRWFTKWPEHGELDAVLENIKGGSYVSLDKESVE